MANVNLLIRTNNNPANIYIRFLNGRKTDIKIPINIYVNPKYWDQKNQKIRNVIDVPDRDKINSKLIELKGHILSSYNMSFLQGEIIDKHWLSLVVQKFFNRPKLEDRGRVDPQLIYFVDYANWWIDNKAKTWKTSKNKYMTDGAKKQYRSHIEIVKRYEKQKKIKLKFKEINEDLINNFISFMEDENYDYNTVKRHIGRFKFFCNRAMSDNIDVNQNFKDRFFATETEEIMEPYLNEIEIDNIFKLDLSNDSTLDSVRDNFIIGLWTGLRVSDFNNNLNTNNIKEDFIEIKTEKTDTWVTIPLHPHVRYILNKRCGLFPERLSDQKFNKHIKTICLLANIDNEIKGKLFDADTKRNKVGVYPKYKLVSSHICRRSFATNLYGLVPNSVIQNVGGWGSEKMMLHYIKKTKREHAEILQATWNKKYQK